MTPSTQTPINVLVAAQTAGGANALIPVVRRLLIRDRAKVTVLASAEAVSKFADAQVPFVHINHKAFNAHDILANQILSAPDVMLLATAWGPSLDKMLLKATRPLYIPSISVIDMWSYYRERYLDPESDELVLPSRIVIMDQIGAKQAVTAGIPKDLIVVTGQPHLEELRNPSQSNESHEAQTLRKSWLEGELDPKRTKVILFASEAIAKDFGPGSGNDRGYTEKDALLGVLDAANSASDKTGLQIKVIVRPHPEQAANHLSGLIEPESVTENGSTRANILASDLVVGMTSMLLIEASAAGNPAISFQPGTGESLPFIGVTNGMVSSASTVDVLSDLIVQVLDGSDLKSTGQTALSSHEGATERIVNLISAMARKYEESKLEDTL